MNIKVVAKNILKKGPVETYKEYIQRKNKKNEFKKYKENIDKIMRITENFDTLEKNNDAVNELIMLGEKISGYEKFDELSILVNEIKEKESINYIHALRKIYIKEIIPTVYTEYSKLPIENKVIFMERGKISPSINFIYKYVTKQGTYKAVMHELNIRAVPEIIYYQNVINFIKDVATAKAIFVSTANDYFAYVPRLRDETKYIQLWHGCGAFKKIGLSTSNVEFGKSAETYKEYPAHTHYDYVTIASPELSWVFEEAMGINKEDNIIVPTGISRTDVFFDKEYQATSHKKLIEKIPASKNKKIILYAPTFRGPVRKATSPNVLNIKKFYEELGDEYILIIKHHQVVKDVPQIPSEYENSFAYDMTRGKGMSINELMSVADILITDYSSVTFEYSLFEKPMIFFTYDIEEYIDERGLYYDFDEITPGPLFKTNDEIIKYIKDIDKNFNPKEVIEFKNKFMCCCDGKSTERILELIED